MQVTVYRYVMSTDNGGAPNYDPPYTTFAICAPDTRRCSREGDLIIGIAGRAICPNNQNTVVWAGVVKEKLLFEKYWADPRFLRKRPKAFGGSSARPDNIYQPKGYGLAQVPNETHDQGHVANDLTGRFVLVMYPAWHIQEGLGLLPDQFRDLWWPGTSRRKHRKTFISPTLKDELIAWLSAQSRNSQKGAEDFVCTRRSSRSLEGAPVARWKNCRT